jgi:hypothetical protein
MEAIHDFGRGRRSGPLGVRPAVIRPSRSPDRFAVLFGGDANLLFTAQAAGG